jgi:hypothetical protein
MLGFSGEMETPPVEGGTGMLKSELFGVQEPAPVQIPQRVLPSEPFLMRRV